MTISSIVSTVIVLGYQSHAAYLPMEPVPTAGLPLAPVHGRRRQYTVNCHDKDGSTFRSYTMRIVKKNRLVQFIRLHLK